MKQGSQQPLGRTPLDYDNGGPSASGLIGLAGATSGWNEGDVGSALDRPALFPFLILHSNSSHSYV